MNFLKSSDNDLEKAKSALVKYLQVRKKYPALFTNRDLFGEKFQQVFKAFQVIPLRQFAPENLKVTIFRTLEDGMKHNNSCDVFRLILATLDARFVAADLDKLPDGDTLIYDMKNFGFKHLMKFLMDVSNMKAYLKYCQESTPTKLVEVHFINCSAVVPKLITFIKPFLNKEVAESLRVHTSLESLHAVMSKECLPNEYGGNIGKLDDLNEAWMNIFLSKRLV